MPASCSISACLDSAEPTKPTGTPMIAAGRGPPSQIHSSRWNRAVGALPIATTAPAIRSRHSSTAAAERVVVALGEGSQQTVLERISAIGTNTITISPGSGFGDRNAARIQTLTADDATALSEEPFADSVSPTVSSSAN